MPTAKNGTDVSDNELQQTEKRIHIEENLNGQELLDAVREFLSTIGVEPGSEQESLLMGQFFLPYRFKIDHANDGYCWFDGNPADLLVGSDDALMQHVCIRETWDRAGDKNREKNFEWRRERYGTEVLPKLRDSLKENLLGAINSGKIIVLAPWHKGNAILYDGWNNKAIVFNDKKLSIGSGTNSRESYLDVQENSDDKIVIKTSEYMGGMIAAGYSQYLYTVTLDENGSTMIKSKEVPRQKKVRWDDSGM